MTFFNVYIIKSISLMPIDNTQIVEVYSFEFVKNFGHSIGVKGGDSCGNSVSRCDPAESVANELCAIRLRRVTAGA